MQSSNPTMDSFIAQLADMSNGEAYTAVFDYCFKKKIHIKSMDSYKVGEKSFIDTYTTKKGETYNIHYTIYGKWCGKVDVLGPFPAYYQGNFLITPKHFYLKSNFKDFQTIEEMVVPRNAIPQGQKIIIRRK